MKALTALAVASAAALFLGGVPGAPCATPDAPETWSQTNTAGWMSHDLVNERTQNTLTPETGAVKLLFKSQSVAMPPEEYVFEAGSNASSGKFVGDYVSQGVTELRFRLLCERPADVSLMLWSEQSSRVWRYRIAGVQTGVWMSIRVPVAIPLVHCLNDAAKWASFEADLRQVKAVGVAIKRAPGQAAQSYWIDDFALAGAGPEFAAWMAQFPTPPGASAGDGSVLAGADLDGDGAPNEAEWIAGTSAGDASDRFRVSIEGLGGQRSRLRWKAAPGRSYQVWTATDLDHAFAPLSAPIDAQVPENIFEDTRTNANNGAFYRVQVDYPRP